MTKDPRETNVVLSLTPREAVALRSFCSGFTSRREFSGPQESAAFHRAVNKIWKVCPAAVWTRFDFDWWREDDVRNYPDMYDDRGRWGEETDEL